MPFVPPGVPRHEVPVEALAALSLAKRNAIGASLQIAFAENLDTPLDMQDFLNRLT